MANPNPSPSTRFGAPNGNPSGGGKTKGQRAAEIKAARISALLRAKALSELMEKYQSGEITLGDLISSENLKLFKDSEDRAHGTPKTTNEHSGPDGGNIPMNLSFNIQGVPGAEPE